MALPGVFSADGLDLGSQMLLASLPPMQGKLLDFGCGAGVIGSILAKRNPALTVNMVDINALALESSRRTLAVNGLQGESMPLMSIPILPKDSNISSRIPPSMPGSRPSMPPPKPSWQGPPSF